MNRIVECRESEGILFGEGTEPRRVVGSCLLYGAAKLRFRMPRQVSIDCSENMDMLRGGVGTHTSPSISYGS